MSGQIKLRIHLIRVAKVSRNSISESKFPENLEILGNFREILIFSRILKFSNYEILSGSDAIRIDSS